MKLPDAAHLAQPWRIHALTPDFRLEDVWALPAEGAAGDFPRLVELIAAGDPSEGGSAIARAPFALRLELGAVAATGRPAGGSGSDGSSASCSAGTTPTMPSPRCATACPTASKAARSS